MFTSINGKVVIYGFMISLIEVFGNCVRRIKLGGKI